MGRFATNGSILRRLATFGHRLTQVCRPHRTLGVAAWLGASLLFGCAAREQGRYHIRHLDIRGQRDLKERPLTECLVSRERPSFGLTIGLSTPSCGKPPFDEQAPRVNLWRWFWADWSAYNHAVVDQDLKRIERWYQARGYYDAKVVNVDVDPPEAAIPGAKANCDLENDVCPVSVVITVEEGEPTLLNSLTWEGIEALPEELQLELRTVGELPQDAPIDETLYNEAKQRMKEALRNAGHARPAVEGTVDVDTKARTASVVYRITPGPVFTMGSCQVEGQLHLPTEPILAAAGLHQGERYSPILLRDMQTEVYALGAFSAVELHEDADEEAQRIDIRIEVTPLKPHALRLGMGVLSGAQQRTSTGELASIPQWDVHLFGRYERRHVFGTLGRFGIEERPRIIFSEDFPRTTPPKFGNLVSVRLNQPGLIEARTDLFTENAWDFGPDPFLGFHRSDIYFRVGARRGFFHRKLMTTLAVQQDLFIVDADGVTSDGSELPSSYGYTFLEQDLRLDFRDDSARPYLGAYFGLNATQAPQWQGSDWTAFRLAPEVRVFLPLLFDIVLASRFAIAGQFIVAASQDVDPTSQRLGPSTYRLRGGGANSNRGFLAGQLGVGPQGGVRRWEASSELRVPLGRDFVVAGFADLGDVNDQEAWRFDYLNLSLGWGLRYYTILGAIRLDVGLRILSLQRTDGSDGVKADDSRLFGHPGAIHLTIGDAF